MSQNETPKSLDKAKTSPPTVVLIPGLGTDHRMWMLQLPALEAEYHVLSLNLPGFGGEPPLGCASGWTLWDYVDWIADKISSDCNEKTYLVGYSMGGTLALMTALKYPHLVSRLALICTSSCWGEGLRGGLRFAARGFIARIISEIMLKRVAQAVGKHLDEPSQKEALALMVDEADREVMASLLHKLVWTDLRARLGEVEAPALVVAGGRDWTAPPAHSRTLARGLKSAEFHLMRDADHFLCASHAGWLTRKLTDFAPPA
jgi:pimeloyl-ACP methyl ester carboxylesterase